MADAPCADNGNTFLSCPISDRGADVASNVIGAPTWNVRRNTGIEIHRDRADKLDFADTKMEGNHEGVVNGERLRHRPVHTLFKAVRHNMRCKHLIILYGAFRNIEPWLHWALNIADANHGHWDTGRAVDGVVIVTNKNCGIDVVLFHSASNFFERVHAVIAFYRRRRVREGGHQRIMWNKKPGNDI